MGLTVQNWIFAFLNIRPSPTDASMAPAEPSLLISQSCLEMNCSYKLISVLFRDSHDVQEAH